MSLESFISLDQGEGMSESALEALRERMAAAAAQIAAIKKEERRQKKKEEELLKLLYKFVKTSQKTQLVLLISRALEQNIPANFILGIIILGNPEIKEQLGDYLLLKAATHVEGANQLPGASVNQEKSLIFFSDKDESLPLKVKIEVDQWIKSLLFQAEENPHKLLKTAYKIEIIKLPKEFDFDEQKYQESKDLQPPLVTLMTYVLRDYLEQNKIYQSYERLLEFCRFLLKGILDKTQENLEGRKLLS